MVCSMSRHIGADVLSASVQDGAIHHITPYSRKGAISRFNGGKDLGQG